MQNKIANISFGKARFVFKTSNRHLPVRKVIWIHIQVLTFRIKLKKKKINYKQRQQPSLSHICIFKVSVLEEKHENKILVTFLCSTFFAIARFLEAKETVSKAFCLHSSACACDKRWWLTFRLSARNIRNFANVRAACAHLRKLLVYTLIRQTQIRKQA